MQILAIGKMWLWKSTGTRERNMWLFPYDFFNFLSEDEKSSAQSEDVGRCVEIFERHEIVIYE